MLFVETKGNTYVIIAKPAFLYFTDESHQVYCQILLFAVWCQQHQNFHFMSIDQEMHSDLIHIGESRREVMTLRKGLDNVYPPPPPICGGYIGITSSVGPPLCSSVHVSDCVCSISPELFNLFNFLNIFYQIRYGSVLSWGDVSCGKIGSLSSKSRSQQRLIQSKYDYFSYIF